MHLSYLNINILLNTYKLVNVKKFIEKKVDLKAHRLRKFSVCRDSIPAGSFITKTTTYLTATLGMAAGKRLIIS